MSDFSIRAQAPVTPQAVSRPSVAPAVAAQPPVASHGSDVLKTTIPVRSGMTVLQLNSVTPAAVKQAVARIDNVIAQDLALQDTSKPQDSYLRQNYQSLFRAQPNPAEAKGTVIMLHGYTAGPWQYNEMADALFEQGYNVYVPRLPGHGFMEPDGTPTGKFMVEANDTDQYENFIATRYAEAEALGAPVHAIGLSGGGNLALRMGENFPQLKSVVAMAPFLGPDRPHSSLASFLQNVDTLSMGAINRAMEIIPLTRNQKTAADEPMPHTQGSLSNAKAMLSMGTRVDKVKVPTQFFTTSGDLLSGASEVERLFKRSGGNQQHGWYHFNQLDEVPHAMTSPRQNTTPGKAEQLHNMISEWLEQGKASQRR